LETPYRKWLNEDVAYIITDEERTAFKRLQTDEEREQFIETVLAAPRPHTGFHRERIQGRALPRIAYPTRTSRRASPDGRPIAAASILPTDRRTKRNASFGRHLRAASEEGGGTTSTFPFEQWRYRYIEGVGSDIIIEFVDPTMSGEYRMTMDPSEKDALLYVPGAGLTMMEQMGMSTKTDRFNRTDGTHLGVPFGAETEKMNQFNRPGAVRQVAAPAGRSSSRISKPRQFAHQLQHPPHEGARRFLPAHRSQRAHLHHPPVRQ
jgi:hypothetical protein